MEKNRHLPLFSFSLFLLISLITTNVITAQDSKPLPTNDDMSTLNDDHSPDTDFCRNDDVITDVCRACTALPSTMSLPLELCCNDENALTLCNECLSHPKACVMAVALLQDYVTSSSEEADLDLDEENADLDEDDSDVDMSDDSSDEAADEMLDDVFSKDASALSSPISSFEGIYPEEEEDEENEDAAPIAFTDKTAKRFGTLFLGNRPPPQFLLSKTVETDVMKRDDSDDDDDEDDEDDDDDMEADGDVLVDKRWGTLGLGSGLRSSGRYSRLFWTPARQAMSSDRNNRKRWGTLGIGKRWGTLGIGNGKRWGTLGIGNGKRWGTLGIGNGKRWGTLGIGNGKRSESEKRWGTLGIGNGKRWGTLGIGNGKRWGTLGIGNGKRWGTLGIGNGKRWGTLGIGNGKKSESEKRWGTLGIGNGKRWGTLGIGNGKRWGTLGIGNGKRTTSVPGEMQKKWGSLGIGDWTWARYLRRQNSLNPKDKKWGTLNLGKRFPGTENENEQELEKRWGTLGLNSGWRSALALRGKRWGTLNLGSWRRWGRKRWGTLGIGKRNQEVLTSLDANANNLNSPEDDEKRSERSPLETFIETDDSASDGSDGSEEDKEKRWGTLSIGKRWGNLGGFGGFRRVGLINLWGDRNRLRSGSRRQRKFGKRSVNEAETYDTPQESKIEESDEKGDGAENADAGKKE